MSDSTTKLSDLTVNYFSNAGTDLKAFTVLSNATLVPFCVANSTAFRLNKPIGGAAFTPTGQICAPGNFALSAFIPATDGLYVNGVDPNDRMSNWKKVQTPPGVAEPFADWVSEVRESDSYALYSFKNHNNSIDVCKNAQGLSVHMAENVTDHGGTGRFSFYDFAVEDNSFIATNDGNILNRDRTPCTDTGNIANIVNALNTVVKLGNKYYGLGAATNRSDITISSANGSPLTGNWSRDDKFDPKRLFNDYYPDNISFLENVSAEIIYNDTRRSGLWPVLSNATVLYEDNACAMPISSVGDMFLNAKGIKTFYTGDSLSAFSFTGYTTLSSLSISVYGDTYEYRKVNNSKKMIRWKINDGPGHNFPFELKGVIPAGNAKYAIGNMYNVPATAIGAKFTVAKIPANRNPSVYTCKDLSGNNRYGYEYVFYTNVDAYDFSGYVNGPVVQCGGINGIPYFTAISFWHPTDNIEELFLFYGYDELRFPINLNLLVSFDRTFSNPRVKDIFLLDETALYVTVDDNNDSHIFTVDLNPYLEQLGAARREYEFAIEDDLTPYYDYELSCIAPLFGQANSTVNITLYGLSGQINATSVKMQLFTLNDNYDFSPLTNKINMTIAGDKLHCTASYTIPATVASDTVYAKFTFNNVYETDYRQLFEMISKPILQKTSSTSVPTTRSVYNLIGGENSNVLIDFSINSMRHTANVSNTGHWTLKPLFENTTVSTIPRDLYDYAVLNGAAAIYSNAFNIMSNGRRVYNIGRSSLNKLLGDGQIDSSHGRRILFDNYAYSISAVQYSTTSTTLVKSISANSQLLASNFAAVAICPSNSSYTSELSTVPPNIGANNFAVYSLARVFNQSSTPSPSLLSVYVSYMSEIINPDGYFYATLRDVTGVSYSNPSPIPGTRRYQWVANIQTSDSYYSLLKHNPDGSISRIRDIPFNVNLLNEVYGPDSWSFINSDAKLPDTLAFEGGSMIKINTPISNIDNWMHAGSFNIQNGSKKYAAFNNKVLTWNTSDVLFLLNLSDFTYTTFNARGRLSGSIAAVQNANNENIYVFTTAAARSGETCTLRIYSGTYSSFGENWEPELVEQVDGIDFLETGSICLVPSIGEDGKPANMLIYSSTNNGIKKLPAKNGYAISCDVIGELSGVSADGAVLKDSPFGVLVSGNDRLYNVIHYNEDTEITTISSETGPIRDAFLNYAVINEVSSYTLINQSRRPSIIEISANGTRAVKDLAFSSPVVYDVSSYVNASHYGNVNFHSSDGLIYQLSSDIDTPIGDSPHEVYNGAALLSGMMYGFPDPEEELSNYRGLELEQMHVSSFDIDLSSAEKTVFIDNLYNTLKLSDDFEQIYWVAIAQLDNRVSSVVEDDVVVWDHYPQRYKLNELYDQTFRFADVRDWRTTSAETILTSQDGLFTYKALPRADWNISRLRKIIREPAHLDNVCEELGLNPDYVSIINDIQTSPYGGVLQLGSGHSIAVYSGWRHDIKYFGTCVQPYSMFNSRIQDIYVTSISKYGNDDLNFVLGTSQGFIHLINGHLLAKSTYTDLDNVSHLLSGNCTYAGCHEIDNGTSIENRFLFANDHMLFNVVEHSFDAKCEINRMFRSTDETINDIFRIGEGAYAICTDKGIYTSRPRLLIKDYLDDYVLSDLNNDVDRAFSRMLADHVSARHFAGSDMDVINHKIDKDFNPYPADFTNVSPVITSRHVLDVDNDLVEFMEVRLTDDQAASNVSNIFAAVKSEVLNAAATVSRTYAPPGWFDYVVDVNDPAHIVDYSDVRYICRKWRSGVVEFYIYIPTTFTYYFNNVAGYSQSPYAGLSLVRPNAGNIQVVNDVNALNTTLRLFISNTTYKLNTIYMAQIVGNSLPLKIYKDSTYCDSNRAGLFDSIIQPSVVRALPAMVGRSKNNVNTLMNASEQICLDFSIYGTDAQAIHIMAR